MPPVVFIPIAISAAMMAASYAYQKFATKPMKSGERDLEASISDTRQYIKTVYGYNKVPLDIVFHDVDPANSQIWWVVAVIGHGEIESIDSLAFDDRKVIDWENDTGFLKPFSGYVNVQRYYGTENQTANATLVSKFPDQWNSSCQGNGIAYLVISIDLNKDAFPNGLPGVMTVKCKGKKVKDIRDPAWPDCTPAFSSNPSNCILDYYVGGRDSTGLIRYGFGARTNQIKVSKWITEANYCDDLVTVPINSPPAPKLALVNSAGNLDADAYYQYRYTYRDASNGHHSEAGSKSKKIKTTKTKQQIILTEIQTNATSAVTNIDIYRTEGGGSVFKYAGTIANSLTSGQLSWTDNVPDSSLGATAPSDSTMHLSTPTQKRYSLDGIVSNDNDTKKHCEELLTSCRGEIVFEGGKYLLHINKAEVTSNFKLTPDNIIGDWQFEAPGVDPLANIVKVSFVNNAAKWDTDFVFWPADRNTNRYLADDAGDQNEKTIELFYTIHKIMARQIGQVVRKESRQGLVASCLCNDSVLQGSYGDVIPVTWPGLGWNQKLCRIVGMTFYPTGETRVSLRDYDDTVYDYETIALDTVGSADTNLDDPLDAPDEVSGVTTTTEKYIDKSIPNIRIRVNYTDPKSMFWVRSEVYIRKGGVTSDNVYTYYTSIDRFNKGIFYIFPVEAFITYYIKIQSVSTLGAKQNLDDVEEYTHTVVIPAPERVKGLEAFTRGNDENVYGKYFAVRWHPMATGGYGDGTANVQFAQRQTTIYEGTKYFVEVAMAFPSDVGNYLSGSKIYGLYFVVRSETTELNRYVYTYEDDIEDVNALFETLKDSKDSQAREYYNTYYGTPNRAVLIQVSAIDQYSQRGASTFIVLTNPAPDMKDAAGNLTSPQSYPEKNALRIEWKHPFQEYDISHFILKLAEAYNPDDSEGSDGLSIFTSAFVWKANTIFNVNDLVYPTVPNGHVYVVLSVPPSGGKTGAIEPNWPVPTVGIPHPTIINGSVTFKHNSIYLTTKIASLSTITSSDDEINTINYVYTFTKLDPKKDYIAQVIPYDVFGRGSASGIQQNNTRPFLNYDETSSNIIAPQQVNTPTMDLPLGSNNIKVSWDLLTAVDIKRYIVDWRGSGNGTMPTLAEVEQGYLDSDNDIKCYGYTVQVDIDGQGNTKNWILIQDAKPGYTYWARVRAENTSYIKGAWSPFGTHVFLIPGVGADELSFTYKQYYFTGTLTATDYDTCSWGSGTLKFKKSTGTTTTDYSISSGNTGNLAGNSWLIWKGSGTALEAIIESDLFTNATYKDAVTIAYLIPNADTTQKITILPTQEKKNTLFSSSVIAANSIVAAAIQAGAVKANKIDVDAEIAVGHSSGGKIVIKNNADNKTIALSAVNGGTPFIRVAKTGYDATSETDPNNLNFDSTYSYFKIVETGYTECAFSSGALSAYSYTSEDKTITISSTSGIARAVVGFIGIAGGYVFGMPYEPAGASMLHREVFSILYNDTGSGQIIVRRELYNYSGSDWNPIPASTQWVRWYLLAETVT